MIEGNFTCRQPWLFDRQAPPHTAAAGISRLYRQLQLHRSCYGFRSRLHRRPSRPWRRRRPASAKYRQTPAPAGYRGARALTVDDPDLRHKVMVGAGPTRLRQHPASPLPRQAAHPVRRTPKIDRKRTAAADVAARLLTDGIVTRPGGLCTTPGRRRRVPCLQCENPSRDRRGGWGLSSSLRAIRSTRVPLVASSCGRRYDTGHLLQFQLRCLHCSGQQRQTRHHRSHGDHSR